jgi:hypothetical protein
MPLVGIIGIPFSWLINDKEGLDDCVDWVKMGGFLLIQPIMFWVIFIKGRNPITEMLN